MSLLKRIARHGALPQDQRGFSLIELLIAMSIFALISGFSAANYRRARQSDELRQGSQVLASQIRRAQTMAIAGEGVFLCGTVGSAECTTNASCGTGKTCLQGICVSATSNTCKTNSDCANGATCNRTYPTGYGIRLSTVTANNTKSILFVDIDGDRAYDAGEAIRTDSLASGPYVSLTGLSPVSGGVLDIVFTPPKPTIYFNNAIATASATLTMTHSLTGGTRTVTVNRVTGQISAD